MCQIVQVPLYITSDSVEFNDFSSLFFFTVSLVKPLNRQQLVLILEPYTTVLIPIVSIFIPNDNLTIEKAFQLSNHENIIYYTLWVGAILQSPCPSVRSHFPNISQLLLEEMTLYLIYGFGMVTCTVFPLSRFTAHLLPVYRATYKWMSGVFLARRSVQHLVFNWYV
jgi:hypothetical protein